MKHFLETFVTTTLLLGFVILAGAGSASIMEWVEMTMTELFTYQAIGGLMAGGSYFALKAVERMK